MSGPKRNPDRLNTIGIVVVGICAAVLVYVTIVALQAFYMDDTSEIQTMADYGGQDTTFQSLRMDQKKNIVEPAPNPPVGGKQTYRIPIDNAIKIITKEAKADAANLVPSQGRSDQPTALPIYGRPKPIDPGAGSGAGSAAGSGAGSAAGSDAGSADAGSAAGSAAPPADAGSAAAGSGSAAEPPSVTPTPTGGQGPGGGAPKGTQGRPTKNPGPPATGKTPARPKGNAR